MKLFRRIPPSVSIPFFYIVVSVTLALRLLFGTVLGALIVSLFLYIASPRLWGIEPLSFHELIIWVSQQSEEFKIALSSAALTVAGFVVAFHTATINWQDQLKAQLKTQAAGEVEEHFCVVGRLISDAEIYVKCLIDAVDKLQKVKDSEEARFAVNWAIEQSPKFLSTRDQISQALVQVYRIKGRNYTILSSGWGLPDAFDQATTSLKEIGDQLWIHIPVVNKNDPNYLQQFLDQVNIDECRRFAEAVKKYTRPMLMLAGSIKGHLLSPVMGFTFPMFACLISNRKRFRAEIEEFYRVMNKG